MAFEKPPHGANPSRFMITAATDAPASLGRLATILEGEEEKGPVCPAPALQGVDSAGVFTFGGVTTPRGHHRSRSSGDGKEFFAPSPSDGVAAPAPGVHAAAVGVRREGAGHGKPLTK